MSYYLYLINYHCQQLPSHILKMLAGTLVFFQLHALPVCGPSLGVDATSRLQHLCNRAVQITCGLKKYDHVSAACHTLGWLTFDYLVQHHTQSYELPLYLCWLDPSFQFGSNHSYGTTQPPYFCNIFQYSTSFGQRYFRSWATTWWNHALTSLTVWFLTHWLFTSFVWTFI